MLIRKTALHRLWRLSGRTYSTKTLVPTVGLEIHLQIASQSKLFSPASTAVGGGTNRQVSLFDAAIPGTLPTLNRRCVEAAVQTALALKCSEINNVMRFDRKHYFYADMPAGFQITQQFHPIARNGVLDYFVAKKLTDEPVTKSCRIHQIQIEQDSGKSIHDNVQMCSFIDLNRAGVGLLEIVFEPDLRSGNEAASLVRELVAIVKALKVCSGRMDEGALRVDANISVHEPGTPLGTRTEVKNLNSIASVNKAVDYEIERQIEAVRRGEQITNVTMTYDTETKSTVVMRDKEVLQDYRFFPEPNIPVVNLKESGIDVEEIRSKLPPLPQELRQNLIDNYNLKHWAAIGLIGEPDFHEFFLKAVEIVGTESAFMTAHTLLNHFVSYFNENSIGLSDVNITPEHLAELVSLRRDNKVSTLIYRKISNEMLKTGKMPKEIVEQNNWWIIDDQDFIIGLCDEAVGLHPKDVAKYLRGRERSLNPLLKHIRLAAENRADMTQVEKILITRLRHTEFAQSQSEQELSR